MSAFIVDRETIQYLIQSAIKFRPDHGNFSWYDAKHEWQTMPTTDRKAHDETGQMLWNENIASVQYRYNGESLDTLPGPIGEDFSYKHTPRKDSRGSIIPSYPTPGKCFAMIDMYEYQSCEHPGWDTSSAKAFCDALRKAACRKVEGYEW